MDIVAADRHHNGMLVETHHSYEAMPIIGGQKPIKKGDTLRVFHGFRNRQHAIEAVKSGLSGKDRADRNYSYEFDNNPSGLFVTLVFKVAAEFGQTIIEFDVNESELEAPVWPGGSYTVQGQMARYFGHGAKGRAARRQRMKAADAEAIDHANANPEVYGAILASDRPNLTHQLMFTREAQALFVGDLSPSRIKAVYVRNGSQWESMDPETFAKDAEIDTARVLAPDEEFDGQKFLKNLAARVGYDDPTELETVLMGIWSNEIMRAPQGMRMKVFMDMIGQYLWPRQYRGAVNWFKQSARSGRGRT